MLVAFIYLGYSVLFVSSSRSRKRTCSCHEDRPTNQPSSNRRIDKRGPAQATNPSQSGDILQFASLLGDIGWGIWNHISHADGNKLQNNSFTYLGQEPTTSQQSLMLQVSAVVSAMTMYWWCMVQVLLLVVRLPAFVEEIANSIHWLSRPEMGRNSKKCSNCTSACQCVRFAFFVHVCSACHEVESIGIIYILNACYLWVKAEKSRRWILLLLLLLLMLMMVLGRKARDLP